MSSWVLEKCKCNGPPSETESLFQKGADVYNFA
jgi:hypothetical protein